MAFNPNTDIKPSDMLVLDAIKNEPKTILDTALKIKGDDEYSTGLRGVLLSMFDFITKK